MAVLGAPIVLDATHGEGGGALLRTALVMAALTQQPVNAVGIRGATKYPGLSEEDLVLVRVIAAVCGAETVGAQLGSHELSFLPTRRPRALSEADVSSVDRDTGGSVGALVVASCLTPLLARTGAYSTCAITGETYGHGLLTFDYFQSVTLSALRRLGIYAHCDQHEAGYGRNSQGLVRLEVEPSAVSGADWSNRGKLVRACAILSTSELNVSVAKRGEAHLLHLARSAGVELEVAIQQPSSRTSGAHVTMWGEYESGIGGSTGMGRKGLRMESVVQTAFEGFQSYRRSEAALDAYVADQVLLAAAIADSDTVFTTQCLTQRLLTVSWVIKQFTPIRITISGREGEPGTVVVRK